MNAKALGKHEEDLRNSLRLVGSFDLETIHRRLETVKTFDDEAERLTKHHSKWGCITLIAAFVLLFVLMAAGQVVIVAVVVPVLVILSIRHFVLRGRAKKYDVPDERYLLLESLLAPLSHDMEDDARVALDLDLSAPTADKKKVSTEKVEGTRFERFVDPWLSLRGEFRDGSRMELEVEETSVRRTYWKRSSSGKSKRKVKTKSKTSFTLRLTDREERWGDVMGKSEEIRKFIRLPGSAPGWHCAVDGRRVTLGVKGLAGSSGVAEVPPPAREFILMGLMSIYRYFSHCRGGDASS